MELLEHRPLPFSIEVVGFSEEEGVRFGAPFIGSRALAGTLDADLLGASMRTADPSPTPSATSAWTHRASATRAAEMAHLAISNSTSNKAPCSMASPSPLPSSAPSSDKAD